VALADILKRIDSDAESEASRIVEAAEEAADAALAAAQERAEREHTAVVERARHDAEEEARLRVARARLRGRDRVLAEKRALIDRVLAKAEERIVALPQDRYAALLAARVAETARGGETVLLGSADEERLSAALPGALAEAGVQVTIGGTTEDVTHGLLVVGRRMRVEVSVRSMLEGSRERAEAAISRILFGEDEE